MAVQPLPMQPMQKKAKEWSPIDRMLANKRSSKSASPKPKLLHASATDLPPLPQAASHDGATSRLHTASTQTLSWQALLTESIMPERERISALQAEMKAMRALLRDRDQDTRTLEARGREEEERLAEIHFAYKAELDGLWQQHEERLTEANAKLHASQDRCAALEAQVAALQAAALQDREDMQSLRCALDDKRGDVISLKKKNAAVQDELATVSRERDRLLERLEVEQAEVMARVNAMERRMELRSAKSLE